VFEELEQSAREERTVGRSVSSDDDSLPGDAEAGSGSLGDADSDRIAGADVAVVDGSNSDPETTADGQSSSGDGEETLVGGGPDRVVADSGVEDVFDQLEESGNAAEPSPEVTTGSGPSADEIVSSASAPLQPDPQTSGDETAAELFEEFSDEMAETVGDGNSMESELADTGEDSEAEGQGSETMRFDEAMEWASEKHSPFEAPACSEDTVRPARSGTTEVSASQEGSPTSRDAERVETNGTDDEERSSTEGDDEASVDEGEPTLSPESEQSFVDVAAEREVDLDEILGDDLPVEELIDAMNDDVEGGTDGSSSSGSGDDPSGPITDAEGRTPSDADTVGPNPAGADRGGVEPAQDPTTIDPEIPIREAEHDSGVEDSGERISAPGDSGERELPTDPPPGSSVESSDADSSPEDPDSMPPKSVDVPSSTDDGEDSVLLAIREALEEFFHE